LNARPPTIRIASTEVQIIQLDGSSSSSSSSSSFNNNNNTTSKAESESHRQRQFEMKRDSYRTSGMSNEQTMHSTKPPDNASYLNFSDNDESLMNDILEVLFLFFIGLLFILFGHVHMIHSFSFLVLPRL
jgi:hypothetical protein